MASSSSPRFLVLAVAVALMCVGWSCGQTLADLCLEERCSGHGLCAVARGAALCVCDVGFRAGNGLTCEPEAQTNGDAGLDAGADAGGGAGLDAGRDGGFVLDAGSDGGAVVDAGRDAGPVFVSDGGCTALYAQHPLTLVSGTTAHNEPWPAVTKPARGVPQLEETYATCRVRASDHVADGTRTFARTDYSRRQAFNADSTRYLIYDQNGSWWLYDARTYAKVRVLTPLAGDAEPQWHPTNPSLLYYLPRNGGLVVNELDVDSAALTRRVVGNFSTNGVTARWPTAAHVWTKSEGSPSADARYWAFMVEDASYTSLGLITWDLQTDRVLAYYDLVNEDRPDHLSMTPTGNFVVVSWNGRPPSDRSPGVTIFDRDFTNRRLVNPASPTGEHSDIALDSNGNDVYLSVDSSGNGQVYMVTLTQTTLVRNDLFPIWLDSSTGSSTGLHFSGKAFNKPGWALVSTYSERGSKQWLMRKVFALRLTPQPTVYHLAHTHEIYNSYATEPHASVNRDFTKVIFNSNWDVNTSTDVDAYMVELPPGAIP